MNHIVPPSLLFDYQIRIPECGAPNAGKSGALLNLTERSEVFFPALVNGIRPYARLNLGWNADGFAIRLQVQGKSQPCQGTSAALDRSDGISFWIDTRPSGQVHRATQYCHYFTSIPVDEQHDGQPGTVVREIAQQREQRQESDTGKFQHRFRQQKDGYELEIWIPGSQLYGYREIEELRRMGFYCVVHDTELGEQPLSIADDFPVSFNPSTWLELELCK
jgi:hypothetical protein